MNAHLSNNFADTDSPRTSADFAPAHRTNVFRMLLKREFWEHRGGFLWAPVITGLIMVVLSILGSITGTVLIGEHMDQARQEVTGGNLNFNGKVGMEAAVEAFGMAGDVTLLTGVTMTCTVLAFTVFFYALGCLYDDRKDRSVLFWKSMPVSDTQIVLSKVTWALLLAPVLAIVIGSLTGIVLWLVSAATVNFNGAPGASGFFTHSHPLKMLGNTLAMVPLYALWALPTIGWLMLCSAWARTKPFLWAVLLPILGAILVSWMDSLPGIEIPHGKIWYVMVVRGLLSMVPGSWYWNDAISGAVPEIKQPGDLAEMISVSTSWQAFATAELWIGVATGAAMIYAAIRLRRWRDEG